jgi:phytoene synthase
MTIGEADLSSAYATAESITKQQARNFYYGIRLLSRQKRSALCAVYALARRIDDIGDGELPVDRKRSELAALRRQLDTLGDPAGESSGFHKTAAPDPVIAAVADVSRHFPIPLGAFGELIDGVESDVTGRRYETFDELVGYCRCVAGSIGRLCLGIFGSTGGPRASELADILGIALQQVNILRDIREDLLNGRVYLPAADLRRFGVELRLDDDGALVDDDGRLSELIRFSAVRAEQWYSDGLRLVPLLDARSAACCRAMSGIYRQLLASIAADPSLVFDQRLSLPAKDKLRVAARSLAGRDAVGSTR